MSFVTVTLSTPTHSKGDQSMNATTSKQACRHRTSVDALIDRFYREGRRRYGLTATFALAYARDRLTLWRAEYSWHAEPDDDGELVVFLLDLETEDIVDALGGIDLPYSVSDHGNVNYDDAAPYLVATVAAMVREQEGEDMTDTPSRQADELDIAQRRGDQWRAHYEQLHEEWRVVRNLAYEIVAAKEEGGDVLALIDQLGAFLRRGQE